MTNSVEEKDFREMAAQELLQALEEEKQLQHKLFRSLLPKDEADERDCILEVRAGKAEPAMSVCMHILSFLVSINVFGQLVIDDDMQVLEEKRRLCLQWTYLKCRICPFTGVTPQHLPVLLNLLLINLSLLYYRYEKYSQKNGWKFDAIDIMESALKGYKV